VYICDFHREQCWLRWSSLSKHGVTNVRDELLELLRKTARAVDVQAFQDALQQLQSSPPARERTCCDATDCNEPSEQSVRWISCDVCGRWLHFLCVGLTRAPRGSYVCVVCRAQYD